MNRHILIFDMSAFSMSFEKLFSNKIKAKKLRKMKSEGDWKVKVAVKKSGVILEQWRLESVVEKKSNFTGYENKWPKFKCEFKKFEFELEEAYFDKESDGWFVKDSEGIIHTAYMGSAYSGRTYPKQSREEIMEIMNNVKELAKEKNEKCE